VGNNVIYGFLSGAHSHQNHLKKQSVSQVAQEAIIKMMDGVGRYTPKNVLAELEA